MIHAGFPLPERPRNLDEASDRGFDTDSLKWDRVTPEPLDAKWQAALDGAIKVARHLRDDTLGDERCGIRCWDCDERMCAVDGPEPRACGVTCEDCPCDCSACLRVREDMRDELLGLLEREARS